MYKLFKILMHLKLRLRWLKQDGELTSSDWKLLRELEGKDV